jgi:oxalate decarboxylase family bicupin protein
LIRHFREASRFLQKEGDLWYFPAGFPHSLQATNATADGAEFLLVFPSGDFSEIDTTFQLTDWLAHIPKEVLAKNFQTDISAFDYIPGEQLYIFPSGTSYITRGTTRLLTSSLLESPADNATAVSDPQGQVPQPYSFSFSTYPVTNLTGGTVKIVDSTIFNISQEIAVAEVTVEPGAMRELHVRGLY